MTLKQQILADMDLYYNTDDFAESVVYTPHEGAPKTIPALIDYGSGIEGRGSDSHGVRAKARILVRDISEPLTKGRDTMTINGVAWVIMKADLEPSGQEWIVDLSRKTD